MSNDALPMHTFLSTFTKWLEAVEHHQTDDASFFVDQLYAVGKMLVFDPEFQRIFAAHQRRCTLVAADEAFNCVNAFLHAITDAARLGRFRTRAP
jgi:hypothetical protein